MTRVKICGLTRPDDVCWAIECGADALGFNLEPSSPRFLSNPADLEILLQTAYQASPFTMTVAVYGRFSGTGKFPSVMPHAIQAVEFEAFPAFFPRIQVVRFGASTQIPPADVCQALLLDAYSEKAFGGTGETVDWDLAAEFVRTNERRVILAGGLTPGNVADAIRHVRPYAVDVSSGVESAPGIKDRLKVRDFIQAAKGI